MALNNRKRNPNWRMDPATAKQLAFIRKLGGEPLDGMNKGQASAMIDELQSGIPQDGHPPTGERGPTLEDTDVAMGAARAEHIRDTERFFGAEAAAAEELAWELKDPDPYY